MDNQRIQGIIVEKLIFLLLFLQPTKTQDTEHPWLVTIKKGVSKDMTIRVTCSRCIFYTTLIHGNDIPLYVEN
jgi:hypothetical protein